MYNKILVAIDGSELSDRALETALDIAKRQEAQLGILYVGKEVSALAFGAFVSSLSFAGYYPCEFVPGHLNEEMRIEGEKFLTTARDKAKRAGIDAFTLYMQGDPTQKIAEFVKEDNDNLIIIGDQRIRKKIKKMFQIRIHETPTFRGSPVLIM